MIHRDQDQYGQVPYLTLAHLNDLVASWDDIMYYIMMECGQTSVLRWAENGNPLGKGDRYLPMRVLMLIPWAAVMR